MQGRPVTRRLDRIITMALLASVLFSVTVLSASADQNAVSSSPTVKASAGIAAAPAPGQLLQNGDFESGALGAWINVGSQALVLPQRPHGGTYAARLGFNRSSLASYIVQSVSIPATVDGATLTFWYWPQADSSWSGSQAVWMRSSGAGAAIVLMNVRQNDRAWKPRSFDLTSYRGQTIQLYFQAGNSYPGGTGMYLDDVRLDVTQHGAPGAKLTPVGVAITTPTSTPANTSTVVVYRIQPMPTATATASATTAPSLTATQAAAPTLTRTPTPRSTSTSVPPTVTRTPVAPTATLTPTPTPTGSAMPQPNALMAGSPSLSATFNSIGVELFYTGDGNANAGATLQFKKSTDSAWRSGLPLWRVSAPTDGGPPAFYGSALLLDAGTRYDIQLTLSDPDGVLGNPVRTASITTRAETIPPASALVPTHYVRVTGDDNLDGTSEATAWGTLKKAMTSAPSGAVVQVGPGFYSAPNSSRNAPITLLAQYPAVSYDPGTGSWTESDPTTRSVIEYGLVSSPSNSSEPNAGVWHPVTFTDPVHANNYPGGILPPAGSVSYAVWKWANPPKSVTQAQQMGYAAARADRPQRIASWTPVVSPTKGDQLSTPAGFAEKLYTNKTYNYGFTVLPNQTGGTDIWLRLPGDLDPNNHYITVGQSSGLIFNAPDCRLSGFEVRQLQQGVRLQTNADRCVIDHNLFTGNNKDVAIVATPNTPPTVPSAYPVDIVVQYNVMRDDNLWSPDPATSPGIPWKFIMSSPIDGDGTHYGGVPVGNNNGSFSTLGDGFGRRVVVRYNHVDGHFDGLDGGSNGGFDRYAHSDMDINGNLIEHCLDDGMELDGQSVNTRVWNNRVQNCNTFVSLSPFQYGPSYVFRNQAWQIGNGGATPDGTGQRLVSPVYFKFDGSSLPTGLLYVLHNTLWTDRGPGNGSDPLRGGAQVGGSGSDGPVFYLRNNLIRTTSYAWHIPLPVAAMGQWDEDYNMWETSDATRGIKYGDANTVYTTIGPYRVASGQGAHSNEWNESVITPSAIDDVLIDPANGNLTLRDNSALVDAGVPVPNISDLSGVDYDGAAPDLGATERQRFD